MIGFVDATVELFGTFILRNGKNVYFGYIFVTYFCKGIDLRVFFKVKEKSYIFPIVGIGNINNMAGYLFLQLFSNKENIFQI